MTGPPPQAEPMLTASSASQPRRPSRAGSAARRACGRRQAGQPAPVPLGFDADQPPFQALALMVQAGQPILHFRSCRTLQRDGRGALLRIELKLQRLRAVRMAVFQTGEHPRRMALQLRGSGGLADGLGRFGLMVRLIFRPITNDRGQVRSEERKAIGRLVRITDPAGAQLVHQHDAFGNLVVTKDPLANTITLKYGIRGAKLEMILRHNLCPAVGIHREASLSRRTCHRPRVVRRDPSSRQIAPIFQGL